MVLNTSKEYLSFMISMVNVIYMAVAMIALYNAINDGLNPFFEFKAMGYSVMNWNLYRYIISAGINILICMLLIVATGW